ncbi:MAG: hypothetical protein K2H47_00775 [Muribaculaceae bacterium]|nr:hypothetical protein [Muribaculaceae bacterium]
MNNLTLLITLGLTAAVGGFLYLWSRTDWRSNDSADLDLYDNEGDHIYYDITHIRLKHDREKCSPDRKSNL